MRKLNITVIFTLIFTIMGLLIIINYWFMQPLMTMDRFPPEDSTPFRIYARPTSLSLAVGDSTRIDAFTLNRYGELVLGAPVKFLSEDSTICEADSNGMIFGHQVGYTRMVLADSNRMLETIVDVNVVMGDMVWIPAGPFTQGSRPGYSQSEEPQKTIYLDGYWIDKYEVTNSQFANFLNARGSGFYDNQMSIVRRYGEFQAAPGKEDFPVAYVSWYAAQAYANWVGKRLPTEAEWEKAARGATDDRNFPTGDRITGAIANYRNSGDPYEMGPTPIGFYNGQTYRGFKTVNSPSPFGVYDMAGNVFEWVSDWYFKDYYKWDVPQNPQGPPGGVERSVRGGSWFDIRDRLRTSYRSSARPELRNELIGFRCAKSPEKSN
ncbi:MAG: formylglycine-generating enzyme family protein [Candidatus Marinimicrobia bacterium]|nr:formylglycine-generating enzyme family protein [Candidatus Neomarinimicrobiota bacterium]